MSIHQQPDEETNLLPPTTSFTTEGNAAANAIGLAAAFQRRPNNGDESGNRQPYKYLSVRKEIEDTNDEYDIIEVLESLNITIYLVETTFKTESTRTTDLISQINKHITTVSNDIRTGSDNERQRCLLYRDENKRLFNVSLKSDSSGLAGQWKGMMNTFSSLEAIAALVVLFRGFGCVKQEVEGVKQGSLTLIFGLVLTEEISLTWVNVSMLIMGTPSISSFTLRSNLSADWPRKMTILALTFAAAPVISGSDVQLELTLGAIGLACSLLCSNLGSRAWFHMKWKPLAYDGFGASFFAFVLSVVTGLMFPYMSMREMEAGGMLALESIMRSSLIVAVVYMLSGIQVIQEFLIVNSDECDQTYVNIGVGIWWTFTVIICLYQTHIVKPYKPENPEDEESVLVEDHSSPVGFKVKYLPDVPIYLALLNKKNLGDDIKFFSLQREYVLGIILAFVVGALIMAQNRVFWFWH